MGKRKSSSKPPPKKGKEPLPTVFNCRFCNHDNCVIVKMDKKAGIGAVHCKVCGQNYQAAINNLSAAVDVYYAWIDACEEVNSKSTNMPLVEERGEAYTGVIDKVQREQSPGALSEKSIRTDSDM